MNNLPDSHAAKRVRSPLITAEEFDAKFEAGEDISEYIDWTTATTVKPGELSPGQKESLLAMFNELSPDQQLALMQTTFGGLSDKTVPLSVLIPFELHLKLARESVRRQLSREAIVQSLIARHFEERKIAK